MLSVEKRVMGINLVAGWWCAVHNSVRRDIACGGGVWSLSVASLPEYHFAFRFWCKGKSNLLIVVASLKCDDQTISLRLLALILCSNCSNTFNKVLTPTWRHTVKLLFETSGHHFSLLKMFHGWSKHFTSRYDPSTPFHHLFQLHHYNSRHIPPLPVELMHNSSY
jgi:hypothetical protein